MIGPDGIGLEWILLEVSDACKGETDNLSMDRMPGISSSIPSQLVSLYGVDFRTPCPRRDDSKQLACLPFYCNFTFVVGRLGEETDF